MPERDDHDSPWKEILEGYFPEFMAFFYPKVHSSIDWERKPIFLDKELQSVTRRAKLGRRLVDKLVKVWRFEGDEIWVLVHVEVQGEETPDFAERMLVYHNRLFDKYRCSIMSIAVLSDDNEHWKPTQYHHELWGCDIRFRFPIVKLLEYNERRPELEKSTNPFAIVVLAQLTARSTRKDMPTRAEAKLTLTRSLYQRGFNRRSISDLYRFIDWMLRLPEALDTQVWQQMKQYEEGASMTYITFAERIGRKQGLQEGLQQGKAEAIQKIVLRQAEKRFEPLTMSITSQIAALSTDQLEELALLLLDFGTRSELAAWLELATGSPK